MKRVHPGRVTATCASDYTASSHRTGNSGGPTKSKLLRLIDGDHKSYFQNETRSEKGTLLLWCLTCFEDVWKDNIEAGEKSAGRVTERKLDIMMVDNHWANTQEFSFDQFYFQYNCSWGSWRNLGVQKVQRVSNTTALVPSKMRQMRDWMQRKLHHRNPSVIYVWTIVVRTSFENLPNSYIVT